MYNVVIIKQLYLMWSTVDQTKSMYKHVIDPLTLPVQCACKDMRKGLVNNSGEGVLKNGKFAVRNLSHTPLKTG